MKNFVGIDLGTTNSAICSYDGSETRIWKSPEQNDVTPSAIYIDRRGNKYVGKRAYDSAPHSPDNSAMLFKRLMGTSTPVQLSAVNLTKTPEECSAEVLKVCSVTCRRKSETIPTPEPSSLFLRRLTRCKRTPPCRPPAWPVSAKLRLCRNRSRRS
jgi:molecular chaperone DnaK (HSP70)